MKRYFYIGLLLFLLGCQREGIVEYNLEKDCLQFDYSTTNMSFSYNFAEQYVMVAGQWGQMEYYYLGDSLSRDTLSLNLSLIGWEGTEDREFKLKLVPLVELDTLPMATVEFLDPYIFRADQLKDTIKVVIVRPEARGRYGAGITFDVEDENAIFDLGAEEKQIYELYISDTYSKPTDWDRSIAYLGEFTEEKYAFMVSVLHFLYSVNIDWGGYNEYLRSALDEFNAEHPDAPKDFTFPVNTEPSWWQTSAQVYLGDYSDAKKDFIINTCFNGATGIWSAYTPWVYYKSMIVATYNSTNDPDDPYPFTFPE